MSTWLLYAILAAVSAAMVSIFGKVGLQNIDANTATAVRAIIMAIFLIGVVAYEGNLSKMPEIIGEKKTFLFIILSGLAGATSWLFYFLALKVGKVSQVAPIDKFSVVIATILAVIFFGEKLSMLNGIGVALIAIGVVLTAL
ncbi:EamA family transporter [Peribacillus glennii]|uniref:EamA family transporter n=1 Tax=Peribacillus glennii TaxID=2303991 RepID=A0A372LGA8_9BACI|nr:EamA family transporter [Peribacillus glennii]RFU65307.1 EamA family transporter [Peribacillus glennii]